MSEGAWSHAQLGALLVVAAALLEGLAQVCLKLSAHAPRRPREWWALGVALFVVEIALYTGGLRWLDVSVAACCPGTRCGSLGLEPRHQRAQLAGQSVQLGGAGLDSRTAFADLRDRLTQCRDLLGDRV